MNVGLVIALIKALGGSGGSADLTNYVKNTDYATTGVGGVVKYNTSLGTAVNSAGQLGISKASDADIDAKSSNYKPIVPSNLDLAIKVGMTTNENTLTAQEKANAQSWLGIGTTEESTSETQELTPNVHYIFSEMATLAPTLGAAMEGVLNEYSFEFTSGETATLLTLPEGVVSDVAIEPNRHYYCSIVNNYLAWTSWEV